MPSGPEVPRTGANRAQAPVFVVGCARSGTTLLYHLLISAGGFANLRAETHYFDFFLPRFGNPCHPGARQRFLEAWHRSYAFRVSGIDRRIVESGPPVGCNAADILKAFMEAVAEKQGVDRWAECTPAHAAHIARIRTHIPDALFIHIIRDGRDVALSLNRMGWVSGPFWENARGLPLAGLNWAWVVRKARAQGRSIGDHYLEIHFEDLAREPQLTLGKIGDFICQDLDYDRIRRSAVGSVARPNTAFPEETHNREVSPVFRWKKSFPRDELASFEGLVGDLLAELGYEVSTRDQGLSKRARSLTRVYSYDIYRSLKQWLKTRTGLLRLLPQPSALPDRELM